MIAASATTGTPLPHADGTILVHERGRCVGVVHGGTLHTHNMSFRPKDPAVWSDVPRDEVVGSSLKGYLRAAERRVDVIRATA